MSENKQNPAILKQKKKKQVLGKKLLESQLHSKAQITDLLVELAYASTTCVFSLLQHLFIFQPNYSSITIQHIQGLHLN